MKVPLLVFFHGILYVSDLPCRRILEDAQAHKVRGCVLSIGEYPDVATREADEAVAGEQDWRCAF